MSVDRDMSIDAYLNEFSLDQLMSRLVTTEKC